MKSVSTAEEEAHRCITIGPCDFRIFFEFWSLERHDVLPCKFKGWVSTQPKKSGRPALIKCAPAWMIESAAEIPPPIVGTGFFGSNE